MTGIAGLGRVVEPGSGEVVSWISAGESTSVRTIEVSVYRADGGAAPEARILLPVMASWQTGGVRSGGADPSWVMAYLERARTELPTVPGDSDGFPDTLVQILLSVSLPGYLVPQF